MPYDVYGWVEANHETLAERHNDLRWQALLCLDVYSLRGDEISNYLFGLARTPNIHAPFHGRGLPPDCSTVVRSIWEDNERFIAKHGEGHYGHTHATWGEITRALGSANAPQRDPDEVAHGWNAALEAVAFLATRTYAVREPYEQLRLVMWATW